MKTEIVPIDSVSIDPSNVRSHDERNLSAITGSLRRFGQQKPIVVDANGGIRAGNGTWVAAKALQWKEIAIVRSNLDGIEATAYSIADNKTTDLSEWEFYGLSELLRTIAEVDKELLPITGFADYEIEPLLAAEWAPPEVGDMPSTDEKTEHHTLAFTIDQWETIESAIQKWRTINDDESISGSKAIEMVCFAYLGKE